MNAGCYGYEFMNSVNFITYFDTVDKKIKNITRENIEYSYRNTELKNAIGERLGEIGKEFGTVTSRKRRCGWFDGVLVRQTIKISGINGIALTKLDVLDEFDEIKICVAYDLDGKKIDYLPTSSEQQFKVKPVYKIFEGWNSSTCGIKNFSDLPKNAQIYINFIEKFVEAKV